MDTFTNSHLRELMLFESDVCISMYMPLMKTADRMQNPVRFRNMVRQARERLGKLKVKKYDEEAILAPALSWLNDTGNWAIPENGLAVFLARDAFMPFRLPLSFSPELVTGRRFYVKPLLPLLSNDGAYFLLTLNLDRVRLYGGSRFVLDELDFKAPPGIDEALGFDENEVLRQSASRTAQARGDRNAMFFGHGLEVEENKGRIFRYFRMVNDALHEVIRGKEHPLVLAGNEYLIPIYRDANTYPHLLEKAIRKNPLSMRRGDLHRESWELVRPGFESIRQSEYLRFKRLSGTALISNDLFDIVQSAANDRVETLFVSRDAHAWGIYDVSSFRVTVHARQLDGDRELLDFAAIETILHNGNVFVTDPSELPTDKPASAIYRF